MEEKMTKGIENARKNMKRGIMKRGKIETKSTKGLHERTSKNEEDEEVPAVAQAKYQHGPQVENPSPKSGSLSRCSLGSRSFSLPPWGSASGMAIPPELLMESLSRLRRL